MKNINEVLQFKIGEESYEKEFEIIPIPPFEFIENKLSLEPYEFFGEIDSLFDTIFSASIILYYNADILMRVKYEIREDLVRILIEKIEESNLFIPKDVLLMVAYNQTENVTILKYESVKLH